MFQCLPTHQFLFFLKGHVQTTLQWCSSKRDASNLIVPSIPSLSSKPNWTCDCVWSFSILDTTQDFPMPIGTVHDTLWFVISTWPWPLGQSNVMFGICHQCIVRKTNLLLNLRTESRVWLQTKLNLIISHGTDKSSACKWSKNGKTNNRKNLQGISCDTACSFIYWFLEICMQF